MGIFCLGASSLSLFNAQGVLIGCAKPSPRLQIKFGEPIHVSGIKVGAPPGSAPKPSAGDPAPNVRLFGRKLQSLTATRFSAVGEPTTLPQTGTQAVKFKV